MKVTGKVLMSLGALIVAAGVVITALKWPLRTALFPVIIGIPVFFMSAGELLLSLSERKKMAREKSEEGLKPSDHEEPLPAGRTLYAFLLILGLFLVILIFGFPIGIPLFVFLYLKIYGREKWAISLGLGVIAWLALYAFFVRLLATPFPDGWVQKGLTILGVS